MSKRSGPDHRRERAVIYIRQSKEREESYSPETQENGCREYAKRREYRVVNVVSDIGVSGRRWTSRPGMQEIVRMAQAGETDVVLVYWLSRATRDDEGWLNIKVNVERFGVRVESPELPDFDDPDDPAKFLIEYDTAKYAIYESKRKSVMWRNTQQQRRELGLYPGGPPPFGYRKSDERGRVPFVPDERNRVAVEKMYELYINGAGPHAIADWLNANGYSTTPRRVKRNGETEPTSHRFTTRTVRRLLDSGFAAGYLNLHDPACYSRATPASERCRIDKETGKRVRFDREKNEWVPCKRRKHVRGEHEAIIDELTWRAYQEARDERAIGPARSQPQATWFLGAGLTVCGRCSGNLALNSHSSPWAMAKCSVYTNQGRSVCEGTWINRSHLESAFALWFLPGHLEDVARERESMAATDDERKALDAELATLRAEERKVREGLKLAARLVAAGDMPDEDYQEARRAVAERSEALAERVLVAQARLDVLSADSDVYERIRAATPDDLDPAEWNATLKRIIRRIVVREDDVTFEPLNGEPVTFSRTEIRAAFSRPNQGGKNRRDPQTGKFVRAG